MYFYDIPTISTLTDDQVTSIAKSLGWKDAEPAKICRTISLNRRSAKVQAAIQAEFDKAADRSEWGDPNTEGPCEFDEDDQDDPEENEVFLSDMGLPADEKVTGVSFGMDEKAAANHIQAQYGLVPRMAKRAVNRGILRDEYHGKGYVVKVTDLNPGVEDDFDIRVYAG